MHRREQDHGAARVEDPVAGGGVAVVDVGGRGPDAGGPCGSLGGVEPAAAEDLRVGE